MHDLLIKIMQNWADKKENRNLHPICSADEMLWNPSITEKQTDFLERYIDVWDQVQNRDYKKLGELK